MCMTIVNSYSLVVMVVVDVILPAASHQLSFYVAIA